MPPPAAPPLTLTLGYSPCPNDTFIFDAMVHGKVDTEGLSFEVLLADVEELNRRALMSELAITKLSYHAFGHVLDRYTLLRSGSALGRGAGPLLVRSKKENFGGVTSSSRVAIPGTLTTANYLFSLAYPTVKDLRVYVFDQIERAILDGEVDAGVIIHENRFTYAERGLAKIADLGDYWERTTGHPIPLGGIAVSNTLDGEVQARIGRVLRRSVEYALAHPEASQEYVRQHAQEMDPTVIQQHIELYVNEYTRDLGAEGTAAVRHFLEDGRAKGILPPGREDYII